MDASFDKGRVGRAVEQTKDNAVLSGTESVLAQAAEGRLENGIDGNDKSYCTRKVIIIVGSTEPVPKRS